MKVSKLQSALQKLHDVDKTLFEHECKLTKLKSRLTAAEEDVHRKMGLITTAKERSKTISLVLFLIPLWTAYLLLACF